MISECINLDSQTFDIIENERLVAVDEQLAIPISLLNKKGYLVETSNRAKLIKPFYITCVIQALIEQNLLIVNQYTKEKIKKIIDNNDTESTSIRFKNEYQFKNLPKGYKMINNTLSYNLRFLKVGSNIEFKTLLELDRENKESLLNLKEWAERLPVNNN